MLNVSILKSQFHCLSLVVKYYFECHEYICLLQESANWKICTPFGHRQLTIVKVERQVQQAHIIWPLGCSSITPVHYVVVEPCCRTRPTNEEKTRKYKHAHIHNNGVKHRCGSSENVYLPFVQFIYTIHILRTEATQYQGYCVSTVLITLAKCELKICSCLLANMECNAVGPWLVASRVYSIVESSGPS